MDIKELKEVLGNLQPNKFVPLWRILKAFDIIGEIETELSKQSEGAEILGKAIECGFEWGGIEGDHHRAWTIDQMLRIMCGEKYDSMVKENNQGEDGPDTYEWDCGISP